MHDDVSKCARAFVEKRLLFYTTYYLLRSKLAKDMPELDLIGTASTAFY